MRVVSICSLLTLSACGVENTAAASASASSVAELLESSGISPEAAAEGEKCSVGAWVLPKRVPIAGRSQLQWTQEFWRWILSVPADKNPELILDADCGIAQSGPVFFVPGFQQPVYTRSCKVPFGKFVLIPATAFLNDYPCPDPNFKPAAGQSLEAFLQKGAADFVNAVKDIKVTVDGKLVDHTKYRQASKLFQFTGDISLKAGFDGCITGQRQDAVSDGYYLMLAPLLPGAHQVVVTDISPDGKPASATFDLKVDFRR